MRHYEVIILPSAEENISEAYEWIAERDEEAAARWYNRLIELILSPPASRMRLWHMIARNHNPVLFLSDLAATA